MLTKEFVIKFLKINDYFHFKKISMFIKFYLL